VFKQGANRKVDVSGKGEVALVDPAWAADEASRRTAGDSEGAGARNQRRLEERLWANGVWVPRRPRAPRQRASQSAAARREPAVFEAFDSAIGVLLGARSSGRKASGKNPPKLPLDFGGVP